MGAVMGSATGGVTETVAAGEDAAVNEDPFTAPLDATPVEPPPPGRDHLRWAAAALAVIGVLVLVGGALTWYRAAHDEDLAAAKARDRALIAASTEIATLNTLDYRDVDGGLKRWLAATTGTLHDQLSQAGAQDKELLTEQKKITSGKVLEAAITDLDAKRGTATAIAAVQITVRGTTGEPAVKRNRYTAHLVRVDGRWLLDTLAQVPVDVS